MLLLCTIFCVPKTFAALQQDSTNRPALGVPFIKGTVFDEYRVVLSSVKVEVLGAAAQVFTDSSGKFEITAAPGATLIFKLKNYYVKKVKVKNTDTLSVRMTATYLKDPETVDVLYTTVSKANNLGSVATIYTNQLTTTPSTLYTYALPGQLAGLYTQQIKGFASPNTTAQTAPDFIGNVVQHNNYSANDNTEIALALRGQTPITIIDNVQRELSSIDPESIESISVLKDAMSNILLGNNSSRGVLLVTTKHPEIGKPRISFTAQTALQQPLGLPSPLPAYQYTYLYNEALQNGGQQPIYTSADFKVYQNHTDPYGHPDVNWFNTVLRKTSPLTTYRLNVSGGTKVARYSISANYLDQAGMFKADPSLNYNTNNDLNRYMINSDLAVNVTKKFTVDLQLFGRVQQLTQPGPGYANILNTLYTTPNNAYPIYNRNNSFGGNTVYTNNLLSQTEYSGYQRANSNDVLANVDLKYDLSSITEGLSVRGKGNLSFYSQSFLNRSLQNNVYIYNRDSSYSAVGAPSAQLNAFNSVSSARYAYAQGTLNYNRAFGKNNVSGLVLYDYRTAALNYDLPQIRQNMALKASYNYDGRYFIEGGLNRSSYNRYPPGKQAGLFYAAGLGWQMGAEQFIRDNFSWISSWKWRATYGKTGNANVDNFGYYNFEQTYGSSNGYAYNTGTSRAPVQSSIDNGLANPFVTWEKADKFDVGTDIALFNDHFKVTADYYHDRYYGLLQVRGNSIALLGIAYPAENIGINLYKGEELSLTYQNHVNSFNYFITGNGSVQATKVIFSDETPTPYPYTMHTGQPVNAIFGYQAVGFFQNAQDAAKGPSTVGYTAQAGDVKYADLNGDGIINQFDIKPIANTKPLLFFGTTMGFNYKGFNLSFIVQGVGNRQIVYNNVTNNGFAGVGFLGLSYVGQGYEALGNRWTPETASTATLTRLSLGNANNTAFSSLYVRSGNYIRLKNAEIGYNLPYQVVKPLRISGIRLFVNGENLITLYGYKGVDPEVYGIAYPIQRVVNAGINIKL